MFLNTHVLTHTVVKSHICDACDKTFVQVGNLQTHVLTQE